MESLIFNSELSHSQTQLDGSGNCLKGALTIPSKSKWQRRWHGDLYHGYGERLEYGLFDAKPRVLNVPGY